eukprot:Gb_40694 [translate_table: standard]
MIFVWSKKILDSFRIDIHLKAVHFILSQINSVLNKAVHLLIRSPIGDSSSPVFRPKDYASRLREVIRGHAVATIRIYNKGVPATRQRCICCSVCIDDKLFTFPSLSIPVSRMEEFKSYRAQPIEFLSKKYDVFLSFRGPDVRNTFVDHLCESLRTAGIHFFKDDEKLEMGLEIDPSLRDAIRDSKIHIPIFSRGYADSVWCLEEVKEMCQSKGLMQPSNVRYPDKGLIIPLFYDVEPSDVRYPSKGRYAKALEEHANKGRYEGEAIAAWKDSLHQVSLHSGWSMRTASGYEGKLVKRVVMDVLRTLNNVPLDVAKHPVGLKERMEKVIELLQIGSNETVITLGIWDMGGLGKTTLAKAVFNDIRLQFQASCFVSNVRDYEKDLTKLQEQILRDLIGGDVRVNDIDHGKAIMKSRLGFINALVVLDDIDHPKQLEALSIEDWFGGGSTVIVTTRDKHILNLAQAKIWQMKELENDEALELFSWHAFLRARPEKDYEDVSLEVVDACGGLPLSLEVLGSFLYDKRDEKLWHQAVKQLQNLMYDDIRGRLEISYQALNPHEKEIFLDIACFFLMGKERKYGFYERGWNMISFWESLYVAPDLAIENLMLKSLVSRNHKMDFVMHDHVRDMGRAIVADESPLELGKRSRLWKSEDALQVLQKGLGTERVRGLRFLPEWIGQLGFDFRRRAATDYEEINVTLHPESLARMPNLQLLWLGAGTRLEGDFGELSSNLRWLRWEACPLKRFPSKWTIEHLPRPNNLKAISLAGSHIRRLPDLSNCTSLLRISLSRCYKLSSLSHFIGLPEQLRYLDLSLCESLEQLPELKDEERPSFQIRVFCLQKLRLYGCSSLIRLPKSIGELQRLRYLDMTKCNSISSLPEEFGNLTGLKVLIMKDCSSLCLLPQSFGNLKKLEHLVVEGCTLLCGLPERFSMLRSLVRFDASRCGLIHLPTLPESLVTMDCRSCRELKSIADMSHLTQLETLLLYQCQSLAELPEFRSCHYLTEVDMSRCKQVKSLAAELPCLQQLCIYAEGIPQCLEDKVDFWETLDGDGKFKDIMNSSVKKKGKCAGLVVCFCLDLVLAKFHSWIDMEMKIVVRKPGRNSFSMNVSGIRALVDTDKYTYNKMYMYIYREDHPLIMRMETADAICIQVADEGVAADDDFHIIHDISIHGFCGMHLWYKNEEENSGNEEAIFERLENDLNSLWQVPSDKEMAEWKSKWEELLEAIEFEERDG